METLCIQLRLTEKEMLAVRNLSLLDVPAELMGVLSQFREVVTQLHGYFSAYNDACDEATPEKLIAELSKIDANEDSWMRRKLAHALLMKTVGCSIEELQTLADSAQGTARIEINRIINTRKFFVLVAGQEVIET
ncbi:MAG: hypothetical protein COX90_03900 [Candidatus Nealsonbacteria bacterium CG_4_10_14_0_2_um_filter_38_17]|uniref:Uncharacterized protein n=2 Tax=Candidatus Nealsoniibacteriota TaxID=1817911 RepID=A0A2M7UX76_9BACT|nr:MAG: hypothetical protein COX36_00670 [Candidatus Nealsonbacteria bacterium CG23_combo_of_CG06-09_8_20_14_all_38_19]PIZ88591.1 MAG: hypothetical protein COX90_03900 [Candidatus Nealsonbacteria bacterium CG_4_10_14_0_2_um_filter_38_17]